MPSTPVDHPSSMPLLEPFTPGLTKTVLGLSALHQWTHRAVRLGDARRWTLDGPAFPVKVTAMSRREALIACQGRAGFQAELVLARWESLHVKSKREREPVADGEA